MADIIISLASPLVEIAIKKLTDVAEFVNIKDEVEKLNNSFTEIKTLLGILEGNPPMDSSLKDWLERLRAASYDMEDLIDCWTTEYQRWKMKQQQDKLQKENGFLMMPSLSQAGQGYEARRKAL